MVVQFSFANDILQLTVSFLLDSNQVNSQAILKRLHSVS